MILIMGTPKKVPLILGNPIYVYMNTSSMYPQKAHMEAPNQVSNVFWVVEPSKIIFLIQNAIPQKEDMILL